MLRNYFKIGWRNLVRNKRTSLLNISGLAVGLATGILMMLWIKEEYGYNHFHKNLSRIHLIMQNDLQGGEIRTGDATCGPIAPVLRNEMPEIEYVARVAGGGQQLIRAGDKSIYVQGEYAEPDLFSMMTFQALDGDPVKALRDETSVVITAETAKKLFGKENAIGKIIVHNNTHTLKVGAVLADLPSNSSERFDMILPFRIFELDNDWLARWDYNALNTWIMLKPGVSPAVLNSKLNKLLLQKQDNKTTQLFAYPFSEIWLHGQFKDGKPSGGRSNMLLMLGITGLFVILIACVNFMNLSTARSELRAREVGVRKSLGSSRKQLIGQFLVEALIMSFLALLLGIILAKLMLPAFNQLAEKNIPFHFDSMSTWWLLIGIGLLTGLVAGSYPAFYLSSFNPIQVLKGASLGRKSNSILRRGLVTFQFVLSIFLIISTIVIYKQIKYVEKRPIGYEQDNLIELPARGDMSGKFDLVKNELSTIPGIKSISAGTDNLVNYGGATNDIQWPGKRPDQNFMVTLSWVQYDWARTADLKFVEGRDFSPEFGSDSLGCLLNQAAVKKMGLKYPVVGTRLGNQTVIGVLEDFIFNNPTGSPGPMCISLSKGNMNYFLVRLKNDISWKENIDRISRAMKKTNPNYPFEFHFTKDQYQQRFNSIRSIVQLANVLGVLAIFISCLGLLGLSAYLAERRKKETGIRKVLGASAGSIWFSLSKDFLNPVMLAFLIATPLTAWVMKLMLSGMEYHTSLSWWIFALAGAMAILIAMITVSYQGLKAAFANPVDALRSE